jgi:hypothetical protein
VSRGGPRGAGELRGVDRVQQPPHRVGVHLLVGDEQQPRAQRGQGRRRHRRLDPVHERRDHRGHDPALLHALARRSLLLSGFLPHQRVQREGLAEGERHQLIVVPAHQQLGHLRGQRRHQEDGVGQPRRVHLRDELLAAPGGDGITPRALGYLGVQPGECEDLGGQGMAPRADRAEVDGPAGQGGEVGRHRRGQLFPDQQVQGLEVQRRDLAHVGAIIDPQPALDQGEVEGVAVDQVERLLRARGRLDFQGQAVRRRLPAQHLGKLVARPQGFAGRHPQAIAALAPGRASRRRTPGPGPTGPRAAPPRPRGS